MGTLDGSTKRIIVSCEDSASQSYEEISPNTVNSSKNSNLFLGRVRSGSDCVAIITSTGRSYTYKEIDLLSDQVAFSLVKKGIKPQSLVLILLPSGVDFVAGILGILKAGCIYVPVDINSSQERIRFILEDTMAEALITTSDLKELYLGFSNHVLCFEDLAHGEQEALPNLIKPDDLACVIYSLGITSQTKGIAVTHRSLVNSVYARHLHLSPSVKKIALLHSVGLDIATTTIFWALSEGASLVIPQDSNMGDVESVLYLIKTQEITHLLYSPSLYRSLLKQAKEEDLRSLEVVTLRGERWHPDLVAQHQQICPQANLYNEYGLTETTTWSSIAQIYDRETNVLQEVTIGRPIANTQMYLLNERQQLVPVGVRGEIYIGGVSLADRYLNQPDLTNSCFIKHPYKEGERLYRTGDTGCYREDGRIEYIGRIDRQIKVLGHQIESEQIEHVLYQYPKVEEAVVLLRKAYSEQEQLVGYVQLKDDKSANPQEIGKELERALAKQLPTYMIPQVWVFVETFKVTPAGKIDRETLPEPSYDRNSQYDVEEPHTEIEEQLIAIWCELLQLDQVSVKDNFFEVGGDSILSIQLVSKARQAGLEINMEQVFESPTIEELAQLARVSSKKTATDFKEVVEERHVPLSPIQQWFLEQKENDVHHYNQALLLECFEGLDKECLERGLQSLLQTHSSLRLRFEQEETGEWKQRYEAYETLAEYHKGICRVEYLEDLPQEAAKARRLEIIEEVQQSLDITKGPLFQGVLFKGDSKGDSLFLVAHHLVVDSVSWRILIEDLESAYRQAVEKKEEIILEPEPRSYGWWSQELLTLAQQETWKQEIEYWEKVLESPQSQLPRELSDGGSNTVENMGEITVELSEEETRQLLQEVPRAYRTQINDILLTALGYAIKEWTGSGRLSLMLEGHGREQLTEDMDLSRTVGWFTSIYPINIDLEGAEDLGIGIKRVKEYLRNIPKKGVGYGMLRYLTQEGHEKLDKNKEPELSFNYLGQLDATIQQKSLFSFAEGSIGNCIALKNQRPRLLEINCQVMNGRLGIHVGYTPSYHQKATIQALGESFIQQLKEVIVHCCKQKHFGYTPSDFPLAKLTQEQLDQVFGDTPAIEDIYPLSPMQEGLLFQKLFQPDSEAYLVQNLYAIHQPVNSILFKKAWELLISNYEILRTGFKWGSLPRSLQFVQQTVDIDWNEYNWKDLNFDKVEEKLEKLLFSDSHKKFDYEIPPLVRFHLITVSDNFHYFVWSFHHLLLDGWCSSILMNDLLTIYSRLAEQRIPKLQSHKPYRIFIDWLQSFDYQQSKKFWKQYLDDISTTSLSGALVKKNNSSHKNEFENYQFTFSCEQSNSLKDFAKAQKITLNTLFQAAWYLLLRYYTQQDDIVFGVIQSGRSVPIEGIEKMVGLFINTLPVRVNLTNQEPKIRDLLDNLLDSSIQLQKSAHVPLFEIQSWAGIREQNLLFDTLLVFENYYITPLEEEAESSLQLEYIRSYEPTEYPLTLLIVPKDQILLEFTHKKECFTGQQINTIATHFMNFILTMIENSHAPIATISPITNEEKTQILEVWNNTDIDIEHIQGKTVHQLFEEQVNKTPQAVALTYNNNHFSFRELNYRANQLAHYLLARGVIPHQTVAVSLERSPELIISMLAISKVGAVYVPIDPSYPIDRIRYILNDCQATLFITSKHNKISDLSLNLLIEFDEKLTKDYPIENPNIISNARGIDIIYTSGSTGNPKGVLQSHTARLNRFQWMWDRYPFTTDDICCQKTPISFGDAIWEMLGPLLKGIKLVIFSDEVVKDPTLLIKELNKHRVTRIVLVPSLLQSILDIGTAKNIHLESLKMCIVSGETCSVSLARKFLNYCPGTTLLNIYGSTEFCADATYYEVTNFNDISTNLPIGKPMNNFRVYIMDKNLNLLAPGIAGEMCISGIGVADGYLNNEQLTREKFIGNPFTSSQKHNRLFRTGDIGRFLEDGNIEYLGRNDSQVKIRGARIELGEVQTTLTSHKLVKEAIVMVKGEKLEEKHLVAYITSKEANHSQLKEQVSNYLSEKLPPYMLPSYIVVLDTFPLTPNGKIDRAKLKSENFIKNSNHNEKLSARNDLEHKLCKIWSELLSFSVDDINLNFFEIGGHSILATKLIVRIRQDLNMDVPIKVIFQHPTIIKLAKYLETSAEISKSDLSKFDIKPVSRSIQSYAAESNAKT